MINSKLLIKLAKAIGDGKSWPTHIKGDPIASYYLDAITEIIRWDDLPYDIQELYRKEIKAVDNLKT